MWSDNAAKVDLLGYEDLLQEIVDLAVDESLQPLTIGAFADWGAGKSTLLNLAGGALRKKGALVVEFSPWLVEGYDDVKTCLLGAVVDAIAATQDRDPASWPEKSASLLRSLRRRISWLRLFQARSVGRRANRGSVCRRAERGSVSHRPNRRDGDRTAARAAEARRWRSRGADNYRVVGGVAWVPP